MDKKVKFLLLQFNNYFNRKVVLYPSIGDYISHSKKQSYLLDNKGMVVDVSFNYKDGVNTDAVINWDEEWNPDYLLVIGGDGKIESRWFITESNRIMYSQYNMTLKRDVIADKYKTVLNAPCFVNKGFVAENNPLIFNKEDFNCNQIKVDEKLICDESNFSWIVVYYNLSMKKKTHEENGVMYGSVKTIEKEHTDLAVANIEDWELIRNYRIGGYKKVTGHNFSIFVDCKGTDEAFSAFDSNLEYLQDYQVSNSDTDLEFDGNIKETHEAIRSCINSNKENIYLDLFNYKREETSFEDLMLWNDRIVKTTNNNYYRIKIEPLKTNYSTFDREFLESGNLFDSITNSFKLGGTFKRGWSGTFEEAIEVTTYYKIYTISYEPVYDGVYEYDFDFRECRDIEDQPFGIIAFPYKNVKNAEAAIDSAVTRFLNPDLSLMIVKELCSKGVGADKPIYDVQLLPYCPIKFNIPFTAGEVYSIDFTEEGIPSENYTLIYDDEEVPAPVCFAIHPNNSKFSKIVFYEDEDTENLKLENQCTFYRLCSPNWSSQFEFNKARNRGINYFNIDCTYKPYSPYIHVNPDFKELYGSEFNDARGLICGGDYSLPIVSNAFEQYKLQNKNFEDMFNRQIQTMDVNYSIQQSKTGLNAILGYLGGTVAAGIGSVRMNPLATYGGAAAALGSITGGITNSIFNKKSYQESRDSAIDMHNFQLDNIKAMPDTLTRVDAFNNNNKIWPVLEKYSCTEEEKTVFLNKLKYEGMTVNALGTIAEYIDNTIDDFTFVKGQIIRLDDLDEDSHFAYEIFAEIAKGVFIKNYMEEESWRIPL